MILQRHVESAIGYHNVCLPRSGYYAAEITCHLERLGTYDTLELTALAYITVVWRFS
jgi:hypothetical protein